MTWGYPHFRTPVYIYNNWFKCGSGKTNQALFFMFFSNHFQVFVGQNHHVGVSIVMRVSQNGWFIELFHGKSSENRWLGSSFVAEKNIFFVGLLNMIVTQWTIRILLIPWITMVTLWNIVFYYNNGMMYVIYFGYIVFFLHFKHHNAIPQLRIF